MRRKRLLLALALVSAAVRPSFAQVASSASTTPQTSHAWEIGPYFGVARHSLAGTHLGIIPDRDHIFLGVHLVRPLWTPGRCTVAFAPEVVPALIVTNNPTYLRTDEYYEGVRLVFENGSAPVYGFGVSPIGFEGRVAVSERWQLYGATAEGAVWFTREVPVEYSRRFNFTFEVGGGVRWQYHERSALKVGYKFHHLSNAYTAPNNPGLDGAVLLVGLEHRVRR